MGSGEWGRRHGEFYPLYVLFFPNSQLPTPNSQLPTPYSLLPILTQCRDNLRVSFWEGKLVNFI